MKSAAQKLVACLTSHPQSVGEGYFRHLMFAVRYGGYLAAVAVCLILHGIFPPLFTTFASDHVEKINRILQRRRQNIAT